MPPTPMDLPPTPQGGTPMDPPTPPSNNFKTGTAPFEPGRFGVGSPQSPPPTPPPLSQPQNEMSKFLNSQQAPALGGVNNNNNINSDIDTQTKMPAGRVELLQLPAANHFNTNMMHVCVGSVENADAIIMTAGVREVIKQFHITWSVSLSQGGPLKLKHKFDKHGNQLLCVYLWDAGIDAGTYTDTDIFPITDKSDDTDYRSTTKTYELRTIPGDDLAYACLLSSLDNSTIPCRRFMTRLKSVFVGTVIFSQEDRNYQTLHALDGFKKNAKIVSVEHDSAQLALARLAEQDPQAKQALDNTLDVQVCVHVHKADSDGQPVEYLGEMKKLADMGNLITDFPKSAGTRGKVNNMLKTIGLGIGSSQSHGGAICWDTAGQVRDAILQKRRVIFDADAENCRKLSGKFLLSGVQLCGVEDGEPWAEI